MATFIIHTHGRLQEWVAEENGYFVAEGLHDYTLSSHGLLSRNHVPDQKSSANPDNRFGAYQTYEQGRDASVSCACHWTVSKAASAELGRVWGECYTVTPCGIFVAANSVINAPEDLVDIAVHVGYQSGSHYATIQALAQRAVERRYAADEMLFWEGEPCNGIFLLTHGSVKIFKTSTAGREMMLSMETAPGSVAELPLFDGGPYPASVRAGMSRSVPLQRTGTVAEHAWLVSLLASPLGAAFNGSTVTLDGARDNWFGPWPPPGLTDDEGAVPVEERRS